MTVLLDTNVVLDLLQKREPFYECSAEIMQRIEKAEFNCFVSVNSLSDFFYLYAKETTISQARSALAYILEKIDVGSLDGDDCKSAMNLPIKDFEDALIMQCGLKYKVDYVITRDLKLQRNGVVNTLSPIEFLSML
ncbi:MAG: PIN domain-containing protein [Ruminococcus sp.]|jgi:predicted nucleic acid-binding protein|nr:PIN domain-containing protein [Ruminococcus sp.]